MRVLRTDLVKKYDVPVPRYTSYPPVPNWKNTVTEDIWIQSLKNEFGSMVPDSSWSLYIHLPFCESLCTFCGCTKIISKNHSVEENYIDLVLQELDLYLLNLPQLKRVPLVQIHLGGGSPTFFSPENLRRLIEGIDTRVMRSKSNFEGSIEVDPRRATAGQLQVLRSLGFNRVSLGVQDFNPEVQRLVNRDQPYVQTEVLTKAARELGFQSVNFDLIYGLPKQTLPSFEETIRRVLFLRPDRIALYSLALVPWIKPSQRLFKDEDLPKGDAKRALYERSREMLLESGYREIGMDHFSLESDDLFRSQSQHHLHRNFMGYTDKKTDLLIGLGMSAISESTDCYHQNEKTLEGYEATVRSGHLPTVGGHQLTLIEQKMKQHVLNLMTKFRTVFVDRIELTKAENRLSEMINDGLAKIEGHSVVVTPEGEAFVRNVCAAIDPGYGESVTSSSGAKANPRFSSSI